jgi:NAD(P)-dependent dehydrogenase (short-subunit alcohol dehydrogenase family)
MPADSSRVVVVTGASGGVGRATAIAFGAQGDAVALLARGAAGLEGAAGDVRAAGGKALTIECDVADAEAVERAAQRVEAELGPIDVWVNNAFSSIFGRFDDISADEFHRATEVTYLGFVYGTQAALRRMKPRDSGVIVQVGSALAYRGIPLQSAYCGAKHAIQGFTESLRCELLHDKSGVKITMVQLPAMNTPQFDWVLNRLPKKPTPVPPIYQPEVAARGIVAAAARPHRREHWIGSSTVATLLANAVMPGVLDRYLARTGFDAQQTKDPASPDDPANLRSPVDADTDHGPHGRFDDQVIRADPQPVLSRHHGLVAAGLGAAAATLATLGTRRR